MKKLFTVLAVFSVFVLSAMPLGVYADTSDMQIKECASSAKAMCVLESSGRVLYGKNIDKKLAMASTTKIFTALTVIENCQNLEEKVFVDDRAVGIEGTSIYLRKGEVLTVKELLLGMMLPSGNDAATALAYHVSGDIDAFCDLMQKTCQKYGAKNSSFKNPHGLDQNGHYTTAYDLALISSKALENQTFYEISTTKSAVISGNKEVKSRFLKNKNKLLRTFEGCNGVKTGFTDNAGRCFVSSAKRGDMTVVCSVLNCPDMFEESARLMEKAYNEYSLTTLLESYDVLKEVDVKGGREKTVKLFSREKFVYPLTDEEKLKVNVEIDVSPVLSAPLKKEEVVGQVNVYLDGRLLFSDNVLTREAVKKDSVFSFVKDIVENWF